MWCLLYEMWFTKCGLRNVVFTFTKCGLRNVVYEMLCLLLRNVVFTEYDVYEMWCLRNMVFMKCGECGVYVYEMWCLYFVNTERSYFYRH